MNTDQKLDALRSQMRAAGVHAYLVPGTDPHQGEYVPQCWQRREWVSGFTGSAGELVVSLDDACLWTDGRYFLQAENELADSGIQLMRMGEPGVASVETHLVSTLQAGQRVGVDPHLLSIGRARSLRAALSDSGVELTCLDGNLVDAIWNDRAALPCGRVRALPTRFTGEAVTQKLKRVAKAVTSVGADAHVVTMLDSIAWLFNIRGTDVDFNPVTLSYAIVTGEGATLFIDDAKLSAAVRRHLGRKVNVAPYEATHEALRALRGRVLVDEGTASEWVAQGLHDAQVVNAASPIAKMKSAKNTVELAGIRGAHVRDGVAMVKFLHWLDESVASGNVTEIGAADRLAAFRAEGEHFQGLSFRTISGYGEHGAIIHYSVTPKTNVKLQNRGLYLVDSGAQYLDGTTDVTRTVALGGRTSKVERDAYTRVLKGHIALACARFPVGATGARLDTLARQFLWQGGLDYNHGTGHGVGAYLNVHEGPQSISPRGSAVALEPGNVQSNEPGYYEDGAFGIRIENLVEVCKSQQLRDKRAMLAFDTLTVCPIDIRPIDRSLITKQEAQWLNAYHRRVKRELSPFLDAASRRWLRHACASIDCG
jgi:Xaa-Pro aminopeptidase